MQYVIPDHPTCVFLQQIDVFCGGTIGDDFTKIDQIHQGLAEGRWNPLEFYGWGDRPPPILSWIWTILVKSSPIVPPQKNWRENILQKKIAKKICEKNREKNLENFGLKVENKIFRNMKNTTRGGQNKPLHLTRTPYNAKWSSLHRPWISGTIEGRSGRGCFPFQNQSFWHFLNRPLIDTISNIKVRWGTIEDDNITTKNMHLFLYTREFPKNGLYFLGIIQKNTF